MSRSSRRTRIVLLVLLIAAFVLGGIVAEPLTIGLDILIHRDDRAVDLPPHPPAANHTEADLQDLQDLLQLPRFDRSFSPEAKTAFLTGVDALNARAGLMSDAAFAMAVSRLVALAGNGHTTVDLAERATRFGRAPIRFAWFADGLYVVRAKADAADLVGAHIVAIDGRPVEDALAAVAPFISGTAERARTQSPTILESPALLQAIWDDTDGQTLDLTIATADGEENRRVAALPPAPDPFATQPILAIAATEAESDWNSVLKGASQIPLSLRAPERVAYAEKLGRDGFYIRINANGDDFYGPLSRQLAQIADRAPRGGWGWVVIDLRFNDGGDELKTMAFTRRLPELLRPDGTAWVLTGNATFSAAIIAAARIRHFLGSRARIAGEKIGDHDRFWSDGGPPLSLTNSGIDIRHAEFLHDWIHGCWSVAKCYPYQRIWGVAAGDLSPDIAIGWRYADYARGRDTVLEKVKALAESKPGE